MSHKSTREEKIAEITERLLGDWIAEIKAGSQRAISDLHNTALERLTEDDAKAIFIQAATDPAGAQAQFDQAIAKAMRAVCAVDATNTVNVLMAEAKEVSTSDRIHRYLDSIAA